MIRLTLPNKLDMKLSFELAKKIYDLLEGHSDIVRFIDELGMDALVFRTPHSTYFYIFNRKTMEHKLIELDVFDEILIRDQLEFAISKREAVV